MLLSDKGLPSLGRVSKLWRATIHEISHRSQISANNKAGRISVADNQIPNMTAAPISEPVMCSIKMC
jgi:hypothetical protein